MRSFSALSDPRSKTIALSVSALLAALFLGVGAHAADQSTLDGRIVFWRTSKIATPVIGRIESLEKRVGDRVSRGEVLARIDTRQLEADLAIADNALNSARAELANAEARLELEMAEFTRAERLKTSPAFSLSRFEDSSNRVAIARTAVETARAQIGVRQAEVERRKLDVSLAAIEAPFDGVIVRELLTVGGLVSTEDPHILVMVDDTAPEIEAEAPLEQLPIFRIGSEVEFSVAGGPRERARVRAILPAEAPGAKTRIVRLEPVDPGSGYSDVEPVTIHLPSS